MAAWRTIQHRPRPGGTGQTADGTLEELAAKLDEELGEVVVSVHREEEEYGGPLIKVLTVWQAIGGLARRDGRDGKDRQLPARSLEARKGENRRRREAAAPRRDRLHRSGAPQWSIRTDLPGGTIIEVQDGDPAAHPFPEE